jgi:phosphoglycerate kinase
MNVNELKKIKSISDENIKGKTILLRVDFNTTLEFGKVIRSPKIIQHMKTVRILCEQGAKVVVLSHQGRKGEKDFVSLSNHFELLKQFTFDSVKKFEFASWQENYLKKIKELKEGEALLLENTRFLDIETAKIPIEEMAANPIIKGLADTADLFVLDALSVAHRPHATVVAFTKLLPSFAGPYLKEEIDALVKLEEMAGKTKTCLVLGGAKPEEPIAIMKKMLSENKVEHVLL